MAILSTVEPFDNARLPAGRLIHHLQTGPVFSTPVLDHPKSLLGGLECVVGVFFCWGDLTLELEPRRWDKREGVRCSQKLTVI